MAKINLRGDAQSDHRVSESCQACNLVIDTDITLRTIKAVMHIDHFFGNDLVVIPRLICNSCFKDVRSGRTTKALDQMYRSALREATKLKKTGG